MTQTEPTQTAEFPAGEGTLVQDDDAVRAALELSRHNREPPAEVPGYQILRQIGEGKYGSVWLAREQNTGKHVAIKFYTRRRGVDWSLLSREVEKLAVLYTSRNVVGLMAVGWDHDPPFYVMEYLERGSVATLLEEGPLGAAEAVRIATAVLHGLIHAHGCGILHCDLKPANVLLDADYEPRLCDFGQSRLSDEQRPSLGTLFYMAPEQADLKAIPDARWDVYALGALLYHMLCGAPPHRTEENERQIRDAANLEEQLLCYRRIVSSGPRPAEHRQRPGVDRRLAEIIDRCLQADPAKRYPNAQAVLDRLTARDRLRARRPLIALGMLVPIVLLTALVPLVARTTRDAVRAARGSLADRALESGVLSANLLARGLERELLDRRLELERIADDAEFRQAVATYATMPYDERAPLRMRLDAHHAAIERQRQMHGRSTDTSWFLTDAEGFQRWRRPESPRTLEANFAHRDYFHGRGREYDPDNLPGDLRPIRSAYISTPFRSDATDRYMVAISVPVWSTDGERVVGLLARTTHLSDLLEDYESDIRGATEEDIGRRIALVDAGTWNLLAHPWLQPAPRRPRLTEGEYRQLKLTGTVRRQLERLMQKSLAGKPLDGEDRTKEYNDPVAAIAPHFGGVWLAAFAPVGSRWIAIVQEPNDQALQPVEEMRQEMVQSNLIGLLICLGLILASWAIVVRAMNERRLPQWRQTGRLRGDPGTGSRSRKDRRA